ncbi:MAG: hypothetical protein Q4A15_11405 [Prevotellaceae bacterium]|nr:hypothetical protein [Prevotellaceae bacterium]
MNRDNHDKQMLRAMQRIARSLESLLEIQMIVHEDLISKPREASKTTCADAIDEFAEHITLPTEEDIERITTELKEQKKITCFHCKHHIMSDCYLECNKHNRINNKNICDDFEQLKEKNNESICDN